MFRLPTHLESLVPPPKDQVPQSQPWRGTLLLPAASPHTPPRPREVCVTAAETENDNQQELWPRHFQLQLVRRGGLLREVHAWLAQLPPGALSRCMLMPDRMADAVQTRENQARFEALARQLLDEGIVAIAPWSVAEPSAPGGLLIYPTTTTHALLVGIVFLNVPFPDFIVGPGGHSPTAGPSRGVQLGHPLLPRPQSFPPGDSPLPNISSTARFAHGAPGRSGRHSG